MVDFFVYILAALEGWLVYALWDITKYTVYISQSFIFIKMKNKEY